MFLSLNVQKNTRVTASQRTRPSAMQLQRRGVSIVLYETKDRKPVEYEPQSGLFIEGATYDQNSLYSADKGDIS